MRCKTDNLFLKNIILLLYCAMISLTATKAWSNGAAAWPGIRGNEITVSETKPFKTLIVDEEVVIDGIKNTVDVKYSITNTAPSATQFTMIFPVGEHCKMIASRGDVSKEDLVDEMDEQLAFKASINGNDLEIEHFEPEVFKLDGDYATLKDSLCSLQTFTLKVQPGKNILHISYNLISEGFQGDGIGENWEYRYYIWPAANWVSKFRHALWRIILPKRINGHDYVHRGGEWYTVHSDSGWGWYKNEINITAPGTRRDGTGHIDFVADDYVPRGQIAIKSSMETLYSLVQGCEDEHNDECESNSLKSLLQTRPFDGNNRCYDLDDLETVKEYMGFRFYAKGIPFLRNEIFARKGFIFKTDAMRSFFSEMPWYKPRFESVKLNSIEKWNASFLKTVEDKVESDKSKKELSNIYKSTKASCPGNSYNVRDF